MLVEFSVGNFWSFKEIQTLQMRAAKISSKYPKLDEDNVVVVDEQLSLLKSKAVFGANGSGKSNLVRAMQMMFYVFFECVRNMDSLKRIYPYLLDDDAKDTPSFFQINFVFEDTLYRYGFEADENVIHTEWLFGKSLKTNKAVRERQYFTREKMKIELNESIFKEAKPFVKSANNEVPLYRENVLFLSVLAAWNGPLALKIFNFFQRNFLIVSNSVIEGIKDTLSLEFMSDPQFQIKITTFLQSIDPSIQKVQKITSKGDGGDDEIIDVAIIRSLASDQKKGRAFRLSLQEAEGTKKIFAISPYIFHILEKGGLLVIDEFDAKLHPQLTRKIVELFHSPSTNLHNAQLVFITHDSNLLDPQLLRRDQISFAQKDKNGATELYSLVEFKGVRNDASFEKDYLQGKYRAVPTNLNQLEALFENH